MTMNPMRLQIYLPAGSTGRIDIPNGSYWVAGTLNAGDVEVSLSGGSIVCRSALAALNLCVDEAVGSDFLQKDEAAFATGVIGVSTSTEQRERL